MPRSIALLPAILAFSPLLFAQTSVPAPETVQVASAETSPALTLREDLPDAPNVSSSLPEPGTDDQAGIAASAGKPNTPVAPKYAGIILPGQRAIPLTAVDKFAYSFRDAFNFYQLLGVTLSATYSQVVDSQPHYGQDITSFGKREGAAALRNTVQTLTTDAIFSPIFHDDPRYYALGYGHCFFCRAAYAATRVVVARADNGRARLNAPLLLGYGVAAGVNNAYYPDQDTGAKASFESWGTSLGGAAIGFEANEFLDDALRIIHVRK